MREKKMRHSFTDSLNIYRWVAKQTIIWTIYGTVTHTNAYRWTFKPGEMDERDSFVR